MPSDGGSGGAGGVRHPPLLHPPGEGVAYVTSLPPLPRERWRPRISVSLRRGKGGGEGVAYATSLPQLPQTRKGWRTPLFCQFLTGRSLWRTPSPGGTGGGSGTCHLPFVTSFGGEVAYPTSIPPLPRKRWRTPLSCRLLVERRNGIRHLPEVLAEEVAYATCPSCIHRGRKWRTPLHSCHFSGRGGVRRFSVSSKRGGGGGIHHLPGVLAEEVAYAIPLVLHGGSGVRHLLPAGSPGEVAYTTFLSGPG
jgi:hypothetical protein